MMRSCELLTKRASAASPRPMRVGGFTLLEVLVVIAVISLLVAILLPSLDHARQQSRRVLCETRLSQLGKAWHMYLRDSKDRFPARGLNQEYNYGGRQGNGAAAFGKDPARPVAKPLNRYCALPPVTREAIGFQCPSDSGTRIVRPSAFSYYGTSYRMNHLLLGQPALPALPGDPCRDLWIAINERLWSFTASHLNDPSRLLLLGDYTWYEVWERQLPNDLPYWHRRKKFSNLAFADGHVEHTQVRKGIHVSTAYTIIPFPGLVVSASNLQVELFP